MGAIHALIGIGEGLITVGALAFLYTARRDLVVQGSEGAPAGKAVWARRARAGARRWPCSRRSPPSNPDGLEWVAEQQRLPAASQRDARRSSIFPDYVLPGMSNTAVATILAGVLGVLLVLGVVVGLALARRRRRREPLQTEASRPSSLRHHARPLSRSVPRRRFADPPARPARQAGAGGRVHRDGGAVPPGAWPAYVLLFAVAFSVILLSELGVGFVYKRAVLAAPFVLAALPLLFTMPGDRARIVPHRPAGR